MTPSQRRRARADALFLAALSLNTLCRCNHPLGQHARPDEDRESPCAAVVIAPAVYSVDGRKRASPGVFCICRAFIPQRPP